MKIGNILQVFNIQKALQRTKQSASEKSPPSVIKDTVNISPKAKTLHQRRAEFLTAKEALSKVPAVRKERIAAVTNRLNSGYYNSSEFKTELSNRLAQFLTSTSSKPAQPNVSNAFFESHALTRGIDRDEMISQIRERIRSNYYDDRLVTNTIAEKLLRNFGL